jgi:hypothetical protein
MEQLGFGSHGAIKGAWSVKFAQAWQANGGVPSFHSMISETMAQSLEQ